MCGEEFIDVETPLDLFEKLLIICNNKRNIDCVVRFVVHFNDYGYGCSYEKILDKNLFCVGNELYKKRYLKRVIKQLHSYAITYNLENLLKDV
jgi:hypothetical protein